MGTIRIGDHFDDPWIGLAGAAVVLPRTDAARPRPTILRNSNLRRALPAR
ncbi:MAG: hypothetical protein RKR03_00240 [Candidatus Competibacter sp.]|nr:hypothetical protein [Candidatus Competibacter sp.]